MTDFPQGLAMGSGRDAAAIASYATGLTQRIEPPEWTAWIPLASSAASTPDSWRAAFVGLGTDLQYRLLELLRWDSAGPFATALTIATARFADDIEDEQVRQFLLEDCQEALDRQQAAIRQVRDHVAGLADIFRERADGSFDVASEILALEVERARLQEEEAGSDFERVHRLRADIFRLETRLRTLHAFDFDAESQRRDDLADEAAGLEKRRTALLETLQSVIGDRDQARNAVAEVEAETAAVEADLAQTRAAIEAGRADVAVLRQTMSALDRDVVEIRQEQSAAAAECRRLEERRDELRAELSTQRMAMDELRAAVDRARSGDLARAIDEVYRLLPEDLAEREF